MFTYQGYYVDGRQVLTTPRWASDAALGVLWQL
jgi:hypothetical protein